MSSHNQSKSLVCSLPDNKWHYRPKTITRVSFNINYKLKKERRLRRRKSWIYYHELV